MMQYVLVYQNLVTHEGEVMMTKMIGPFDDVKDSQAWHKANTPDMEAAIDTIWCPKPTGGL